MHNKFKNFSQKVIIVENLFLFSRRQYILKNPTFSLKLRIKSTFCQVLSYTVTNLLGDVGGNLGLFIGANVVTLGEVLDYIARRAYRAILGCKNK